MKSDWTAVLVPTARPPPGATTTLRALAFSATMTPVSDALCLCGRPDITVQFSSRWYLCARKSSYALHPISLKFPQRCLWNGSNVRLIDDGPLSSFQGRYYPILLLLTQQTFCFSPSSLAGDNRIPIMTMSESLIGSSWPSVPQEQSGRGELNSTVPVIVLSSLFSDRFCFPMSCYSLIKV